jgi:hypothetical protein
VDQEKKAASKLLSLSRKHFSCCSNFFSVFLHFCVFLVSLPSATQAEAQTVLEKQNLIKSVKVVDEKVVVVVDKEPEAEEVEEIEVESESDNEEVGEKNVNLDDEFEKVVPFKFRRLSEESTDEVDHEIAEILNEAEPLGTEIKSVVDASGADIETEVEELVTEIKSDVVSLAKELKADAAETLETHFKSITADTQQIDTESADKSEPKAVTEDIKAAPIGDDAQCLPNESEEDKPPVPIQTYLWEDLKRSKEQVSGDNVCTIHLFRHLQPQPTWQTFMSTSRNHRASKLINFSFFLPAFLESRAATLGHIFTKAHSVPTMSQK